nr:hypothetical protein [Tanacetum cinerariifolium]
IPEWKWEKITMDLVTKLPRSNSGYEAIWVIVDRLTKSAHFLPIRKDYKMDKLAKIYINEIVEALGIKLHMNTAYHPETDGQSGRTIQTLEDMLRACVMEFGGSWDAHLLLIEVVESQLIGPEIMQETTEKIIQIKERLKTARSHLKSYADKRHKPIEFKVRDRVLLKELSCIHDTFHVSNLKKCFVEEDVQVPLEEIEIDESLHFVKEPIKIVEQDVKKLKQRRIPLVKVHWNSKQGHAFTWEREDQFQRKYPHLFSKPVPSSSVVTLALRTRLF